MHGALRWNMPYVVRMHSHDRFSFFVSLFLLLSRFFLSALAHVAGEKFEWGLKRADQNLLEVPSLPRNDKWLRVIFHEPRHVRAKIRVSRNTREFGPWKLIVAIMCLRIGERCYGTTYLHNSFFFFMFWHHLVARKYKCSARYRFITLSLSLCNERLL